MDEVLWVEGDPAIKLAIVLKPRGDEWLRGDLLQIQRDGVHTLVSLLEAHEAVWLGLEKEEALTRELGMQFLSYPIPDVHVPEDEDDFRAFAAGLADRLRSGEQIGVHCRGSIGRSTVTAACALIHLGWRPQVALKAIEEARGCVVPDTEEQERWILRYRVQP